jgi:hypothetical protein
MAGCWPARLVRLFWSSGRRRSGRTTPHRRPSRWPVTGRRDRQVRMVPRSRGRKASRASGLCRSSAAGSWSGSHRLGRRPPAKHRGVLRR